MNDRLDVVDGAVAVRDGRITAVGAVPAEAFDRVIDAAGGYLLPGFVQTHVHLCQTLFRGFADDMPLLEWLRRRVWPMEAAHTPVDAARVGAARRRRAAALRHDHRADDGDGARHRRRVRDARRVRPARDRRQVHDGLRRRSAAPACGSRRRRRSTRAWRSRSAGTARPTAGCAPRSRRASRSPARASCSKRWRRCRRQSRRSSTRTPRRIADEVEVVRRLSGGLSNLEYLADTGLATPRLCAAHCVWVTDANRRCWPSATSRCCTAPART